MRKKLNRFMSLTLAIAITISSSGFGSIPVKATELDDTTQEAIVGYVEDNSEEDIISTEKVDISTEDNMIEKSTSEDTTEIEVTSEEVTTENEVITTEDTTTSEEITTEEVSTESSTTEKENKKEKVEYVVFNQIFNNVDVSNIKTTDLFVQTDDSSVFTKNTNVVSNYEDIYIISCKDVDEAKSVYSYYVDKVSFISDLQDTMTLQDNDDKDNTKDVADLSDVNKESDDAISIINDIDKKDYSGYIALIDSGISVDIQDENLEALSVIDNNTIDNVGHGTKMYNYIKEENPNAKILSIKAFDNRTANVADIYAAIKLAIESNVSVINLSFTGFNEEENQPIIDIIKEANDKGITVIGSAGNFSKSAKSFIPGCIDEVISIGAVNEDQTLYKSSNYDADFYVIATSTSEAAARYSGIFSGSIESNKVFITYKNTSDKEDETNKEDNSFKENDINDAIVTTDKKFVVKYLYVDKDMINGNETIDDIYANNPDSVIYQTVDYPVIYKQDDVYMFYADLPWKSGITAGNALDYCFTNANDYGEVITNNVKYDVSTKIAYITTDAFENNKFADGQLQILVPINMTSKTSVDVNIYNKNNTKIFTDTWKLNIFDEINISLEKDITKEDIISIKYNNVDGKFDVKDNIIFTGKFAIDVNSIDITLNTDDSFILAAIHNAGSYTTNYKNDNIATFNLTGDYNVWKQFKSKGKSKTYTGLKYKFEKSSVASETIFENGVTSWDGSLWALQIPKEICGNTSTYVRATCSHISSSAVSSGGEDIDSIDVTFKTMKTYTSDDYKYAVVRMLTKNGVCGTNNGGSQAAISYIKLKYKEMSCLKGWKGWTPVSGTEKSLTNVVFAVRKGSTPLGYVRTSNTSGSEGNFKSVFNTTALLNNKWTSANHQYKDGGVNYPSGTTLTMDEIGVPVYKSTTKNGTTTYSLVKSTDGETLVSKELATKSTNNGVTTYAINYNKVNVVNIGGTNYCFTYPADSHTYSVNGSNVTATLQVSSTTLLKNISIKTVVLANASSDTYKSATRTKLYNDSSYVHLALYKTDNIGVELEGATFDFYTADANNNLIAWIGRYETNSNGIIAISSEVNKNIALGNNYVAIERSAPAGYVCDTTPHPLTLFSGTLDSTNISPDEEDIEYNDIEGQCNIINNSPVTRYVAIKKVNEDGQAIAGVTFNVGLSYYGQNVAGLDYGAYVSSSQVTTDTNGIALVGIYNAPPNNYCNVTFTEVGGPNNVWNYKDINDTYPNQYKEISVPVYTAIDYDRNTNPENAKADAASYILANKSNNRVKLHKSSANPTCTDNNPNYSLKGAEYKLYNNPDAAQIALDSGDYSTAIGTFITDENGNTNEIDVTSYMTTINGEHKDTEFYVVESKAPEKGYLRYDKVIKITVKGSLELTTIEVTDVPIDDPLIAKVHKKDSFGNIDPNFNGKVKFSYDFYAADMTTNILTRDQVIASGTKVDNYSGTVESNDKGELIINTNSPFPRGYVVIKEIELPSDYDISQPLVYVNVNGKELDITNDFYFVTDAKLVRDDVDYERVSYYPNGATTYKELISGTGIAFYENSEEQDSPDIVLEAYNKAIRGDIELYKYNEVTGEPIEGVKFSITNALTGEKHYIYTNKDGYATTKVGESGYGDHMNYYDDVSDYDSDITDATVWFGVDKNGNTVKPEEWVANGTPEAMWGSKIPADGDTSKDEYKIGTYIVKEERCKANQSIDDLKYQLEPAKTIHISESGQLINVYDETATESDSKIWNVPFPDISTKARVIETSVEGYIDDSNDEQEESDNKQESNTDKDDVTNKNEETPTTEEESNVDRHQTLAQAGGSIDYTNQTIEDVVTYNKLRADETDYTFLTELMIVDKEGNVTPYMKDDKPLRIVTPFTTPKEYKKSLYEISGDITINIEGVDPTGLEEEQKKLVVYESLYLGKYNTLEELDTAIENETVKTRYDIYDEEDEMDFFPVLHQDKDDDYQTVRPADIHTTILNNVNMDRISKAEPITITDRVYYTGLTVGKKYKVDGKIVVKDCDSTTKVKYDPKDPNADEDGFVTIVEEDKSEDSNKKDQKDNENQSNDNQTIEEDQTLDSKFDDNQTTDDNTSNKDQTTDENQNNENKDTDESTDNKEDDTPKPSVYFLKDKDGKLVTASKSFVAKSTDGYIDIEFTVDATELQNKSTIAFEELSYKGITLAVHADLNDEDETIHYPEIKTTTYNSEMDLSKVEEIISGYDMDEIYKKLHENLDDDDLAIAKQVEAVKENKSFYDRIYYKNLLANRTYIAKGTLMDQVTGEVMKDASGKDITAELTFKTNEVGEVVLDKTPNAVNYILEDGTVMDLTSDNADYMCNGYIDLLFKGYDFSNLANKTGTVYEEVYLVKEETTNKTEEDNKDNGEVKDKTETKNYLVAEHKDIDDVTQFIYFVEAKTNAKDLTTNEKIVPYDQLTDIEDTVTYKNLIPGKEYKLKASLHVKNDKSGRYKDGDALLNETGQPIIVETTFTPENADGETKVKIPVNTLNLRSMEIVVFENIYNKYGIEIATHSDINDVDQTLEVPNALTSASITDFKDITNLTLVDTISYNNFVPGKTYIAKGYLVDKATGERVILSEGVEVTAETEFVPTEKDGNVDVTFNFSGETLSGSYVVFEEVYIRTIDTTTNTPKDVLVTEHKDINDDKQTVDINLYMNIQIVKADKDKVKYCLKGAEITLYNKDDGKVVRDVNGKKCIAESDENGLVTFNVAYGNYYAMETKAPNGYYISEEQYEVVPTINNREDVVTDTIKINILDEIIIIPPKTSDKIPVIILIALLLIGLIGIITTFVTRDKKNKNIVETNEELTTTTVEDDTDATTILTDENSSDTGDNV